MKVPRFVKIIGITLGSILVLGMFLPYVISVDSFRPKITSMIEEKTGRKVTIGNIRARFIPRIGFTVSDVALGSPASFGDVNLLKVDTIKGALAWGPLLHGEYQVDSIDVVHPVVVLAQDEHGRTNYDFSEAPKGGSKKDTVNVEKPVELSAVDFSDVELTSARIGGAQHKLVPTMKITGLNVHLSDITTQAGGLKLWQASIPLSGVKMEMAGLKGTLAFSSGELSLKDGRLEGTFEGELGSALKAKGKLQVPNLEKPVADVDLSTPLLDLDQLAGASGGGGGAAPSAPAAAPAKGELIATIRAKADRVRYSPYEGTGARADIKIYDNRMEVPLTMNFYGGSLGVTARLESAQVPERFSANLQVSQLDMAQLLSVDPGTKGKMTGRGEMKMQVSGTLDSNPMNSLAGTGDFALHNGTLPGVNLGESMKALTKVQEVLSFGQAGGAKAGETTFSQIAGDLEIRSARLYTNKIHADTNMGAGDIKGSLGFDQTLDMSGTWHLVPSTVGGGVPNPAGVLTGILGGVTGNKGAGLSVPFTVKGTLKEPKLGTGGMPSMQGGTSSSTQQQPQKKSILDLFKKP